MIDFLKFLWYFIIEGLNDESLTTLFIARFLFIIAITSAILMLYSVISYPFKKRAKRKQEENKEKERKADNEEAKRIAEEKRIAAEKARRIAAEEFEKENSQFEAQSNNTNFQDTQNKSTFLDKKTALKENQQSGHSYEEPYTLTDKIKEVLSDADQHIKDPRTKAQQIRELKKFLRQEEKQDLTYILNNILQLSNNDEREELFSRTAGRPHFQYLAKKADENNKFLPLEEYLQVRKDTMSKNRKNKKAHLNKEYKGVYVLYNKTENKHYVGQSINLLKRVLDHFAGRGNEDVYRSYQKGGEWYVKTILLEETLFSSLDSFERYLIYYYDSYANGYNKSPGNFLGKH